MRAIFNVARREYLAYVTAWGFWIGLILTPVGLLVGGVLPAVVAKSQPARYYAVIDSRADFASALADQLESWRADEARAALSGALTAETRETRDAKLQQFAEARLAGLDAEAALRRASAPAAVKAPPKRYFVIDAPARTLEELRTYLAGKARLAGPDGEKPLFAVFMITRSPAGAIEDVAYWSDDVVNNDLTSAAAAALRALSRTAVLRAAGLDPSVVDQADLAAPAVVGHKLGGEGRSAEVTSADRAPFFAAAMMSMVLWLLVFSIVNFLIMGTIEERSNKIFDTLLTSVRLGELLAGKLLGVFALSATLMGTWALVATAMLLRTADPGVLSLIGAALKPELLVSAAFGFLAGYAMYAAIFLGLGSLCDTVQEAQALMSPLMIFLMTPLFVVIIAIRAPAAGVVQALSWFPPFSPFLMILRAPLHPPLWETLAQTVLMLGFAGLAIWASVRVYRAGAVDGAGVSEAWRWLGRVGRRAPAAKRG